MADINNNSISTSIKKHYSRSNLGDTILSALQRAGKDVNALTIEDLAVIDEFHTRGREATATLAQLVEDKLKPDSYILDVGSGIGGPSRYIASKFGCHVIGFDLVAEYCDVAKMLAKRVGLDNLVDYRQGDATNMPFDNNSFDAVWTQHASMNIADKSR